MKPSTQFGFFVDLTFIMPITQKVLGVITTSPCSFSDPIKLSSIKGEAEVRNIALSPVALQDLLNLPTWLRINSARVNSVSLKIQWMQIQNKVGKSD